MSDKPTEANLWHTTSYCIDWITWSYVRNNFLMAKYQRNACVSEFETSGKVDGC